VKRIINGEFPGAVKWMLKVTLRVMNFGVSIKLIGQVIFLIGKPFLHSDSGVFFPSLFCSSGDPITKSMGGKHWRIQRIFLA
jgi:hypothetical protein